MEGETKCLILKQFRKCLIFLQKHIRRNNQVVVYEMLPMFMEYYFPVMKADFAMLEKYKYPGDFMLPCPILTVKGDKDTLATEEEFEKWREYAPKGNFHMEVEGEHYFLDSQMETICSAITKDVKEILNVN